MAALGDIAHPLFAEISKQTYAIRNEKSKDFFAEFEDFEMACTEAKHVAIADDTTIMVYALTKATGQSMFQRRYNRKVLGLASSK